MSGIARIMLARGVPVSGSDRAASGQLAELAALGADVYQGHDPARLAGAGTVVVSTAIRESNPELAEARRAGLRVLHRAAALASVMLGRRGIAVAGTHGKTTTTAMIATALRHCGAGPGYVVGGVLSETGVGAEDGTGPDFVVEADESDGSFLMLAPEIAVVTCVEADHLDNYPSLAQIEAAFASFARRVTPGGCLIASADDPGAREVAAAARELPVRIRTYGTATGADYRVSDIAAAGMAVTLRITGGPAAGGGAAPVTELTAGAPGRHNALNAAAAFAVATELGFGAGQVAAGLAAYRGTQRRMEPKGEADGVRVLDSYAHHPTEIAADLAAARDLAAGGRVVAVFQPHLFSRTRIFAAEFGAALSLADEVLVMDVYAAREDPEPGVTGELVAAEVTAGKARFLPARADVPAAAAAAAKPGDLVLTMGAGDVTALGPLILGELRARAGRPGGPRPPVPGRGGPGGSSPPAVPGRGGPGGSSPPAVPGRGGPGGSSPPAGTAQEPA
jgi:UDP-N-acetylmuramate--alanine ligase